MKKIGPHYVYDPAVPGDGWVHIKEHVVGVTPTACSFLVVVKLGFGWFLVHEAELGDVDE